ncbi:MAG: M14-type cytosolic carboxypeptidase [Pseudohongiellaceae bacterium]
MIISKDFDSGNIKVVSQSDPQDIQLEIETDRQSEFYQWFHFRLSGAKGEKCHLKLLNAKGAAYPPGFENYRVVYSYDRNVWLRHPTELKDGVLSFDFTPEHDSVYFAYFAPYSMERHLDLIANAQLSDRCEHQVLGQTLDGQDLDLLIIRDSAALEANSPPKKKCWLIGRQHPGETMAQWWMQGAIASLLDSESSLARQLLSHCDVYIVPNMNPDGSKRGHLRTNAVGRNLNREWAEPSLEFSPEVYLVKEAIKSVGADFFLDVHGDESLPYCFIAGTEGLLGWNAEDQAGLDFYKERLADINPDFQTKIGYPAKSPGTANLTMSTAQVATLQGCLAMTLEMPFKDTTATADVKYGWSPKRCEKLGHSCLQAMQDYLKGGFV